MKTKLLLLLFFSYISTNAQCWKTAVAGYSHTVAIRNDGTLWTWGNNDQGQLGNSTPAAINIPTKMGTANNWKTAAAGWGHTVALKTDGTLWAWGYGGLGQLGNGSNNTNFNLPQQIGTANDWQTITVGHGHTVALKNDGTLWAWGNNFSGQLGNGTSFDRNTPTKIGSDSNWLSIATGMHHTIALKKDGTLWAWGKNTYGTLGDGTITNNRTPKQIGTDTDWKTIAAGSDHTIAIKKDGTLWIWGKNTNGALGDNTTIDKIVPTQIGTDKNWRSAEGGVDYTVAIKTDDTLWAWGYNADGVFGNGSKINSLIPVQIRTEKNWQMVNGGSVHTVATKTDESLWSWGNNSSGQLGDGTSIEKNIPTLLNCAGSLIATTSQTNVRCAGSNEGSASITSVSGGTAPYTYLWSNGKTTSSITELIAGDYSCTIKDASSLSITKNIAVTQPLALFSTVTVVNTNCNNNNGSIEIIANGGTKPYQYSISELGGFQDSNIFNNLSAGNYSVMVKDANGCITKSDYVIVNSNTTQPPTAAANSQTFNKGAIVANLTASGTNIKWYADPVSSNALSLSTVLQTGTYYASQTINGCESSSRLAINITIKPILIDDKIPANGLIFYYPFNGNTTDASANSVNAYPKNVTLISDRFGNANSACSFNGINSSFEPFLGNSPQVNNTRTITGWFKISKPVSKSMNFAMINYGTNPDAAFKISFYSKGYLDVTFDTQTFSSQKDYFNNQWTFFAMTFNDSTKLFSLYINNALELSGTVNSFTKGFGDFLCRIGKNNDTDYFEGALDDIAVWNRVLTSEELSTLYTPGEQPAYTLIPDPRFEEKLINLKLDTFPVDGKILTSNINKVTSLDVSSSTISDLTGIQDFVSLTNLNCSQNSLKALNVSKNTALNVLDCNNNQITALDVSNNIVLLNLSCYANQLTALDVRVNTALTKLDSGSNQYTSLDVSSNTALTFLGCNTSQLTTLNVRKNTALTLLDCRENKITSLDISQNTALTELYCQSNQLKDLDVSKNKDLEFINGSKNQLTSLDVSVNTSLVGLYANSNKLTNLNLKNGNNDKFAYLNLINNPNLTCIQVDDVTFANTNWAAKKDAKADFSTNCLQEYTLIPDSNFEQRLINIGVDIDGKNGKVLNKSISNLKYVDLTSSSIKNLTGISAFVSLKGLRVSNNQLTTLDLSKNIHLDTLYCDKNKLNSLNLKNGNNKNFYSQKSNFSGNPDLTCIQVDDAAYSNANWTAIKDGNAQYNTDCPQYSFIPDSNFEQKLIDLGIDTDGLNGKITIADASTVTTLDLSNSSIKDLTGIEYFTSLTTLDVSNNQLTTLDVSKNIELQTLNASSNQLTTLDLSKNTRLRIVYVINNPLVYLNLRNGNNANFILPSNTGKKSISALYTTFLGLKSLSCIQVDNENYSSANWSNIKESTTTYSNTCKSLGIDKSEFSQVIVYPNPTKSELNIQNVNLEKANVYNTLGQLVKSFTLNADNTNNTINLSDLPKGVYFIYLINQDAASAKKIIIE
jgi:alpha-tubulin suppressor-like RCC1 family protein/Leucine-rich repeat (LRR) protein